VSKEICYVYAIGDRRADAVPPATEAIDGSENFLTVESSGLAAWYTPVDSGEFSQEVIDANSSNLEWLGALGYRHERAVRAIREKVDLVPLRLLTLFNSPSSLTRFLDENAAELRATLERLRGRDEWTVRIELEPQRWSRAITGRVESLRKLEADIESASEGKAYLLRRKLDEERQRASGEAEESLVREIESSFREAIDAPLVVETRQRRGGSFPQITLLVAQEERQRLEQLRSSLAQRYEPEGVDLVLSGPWPPYTFAGRTDD
jgi:malonyl CoA-acyl carrier protein transacylase